ncbi:type IV pilus twitching motility protein PilT [Thermoflavimicrobium daqui]|uniref:type IV pilus twitching motility protein PilT n=1 Tax=Thermoflavimicrobium daqui TaxID=2137476 RepID=UPI001F0BD101|nr:PilT/PilU family type 4a pilus ATPase [Thermoflavimicrobium daqui]
MSIFDLIEMAYQSHASDLHISDFSAWMRIQGQLVPIESVHMTFTDIEDFLTQTLHPQEIQKFNKRKEIDASLVSPIGIRCRLHIYFQKGLPSLSIRLFSQEIPKPMDIGIPDILLNLIHQEQGLLLVAGPTGSGKTTTLASLLDHLNQHDSLRIITLEDPIEYIHTPRRSMIEQREIGLDTESFLQGIRTALRQDPDVIYIGELRDYETIHAAIRAAEAGRLVMATLHTGRAMSAIHRMIDAFPASKQSQIRSQLAFGLIAVISQRLLPLRNSSHQRVAAFEVLLNTPAVSHLIRTDQLHQIESLMQAGKGQGMQSLETAYQQLIDAGLIDIDLDKGRMRYGS